jgi:hypothetical protein
MNTLTLDQMNELEFELDKVAAFLAKSLLPNTLRAMRTIRRRWRRCSSSAG